MNIEKIVIKLSKDKKIELSLEEAKELLLLLKDTFEKETVTIPIFPTLPVVPENPVYPNPFDPWYQNPIIISSASSVDPLDSNSIETNEPITLVYEKKDIEI